METLQKNKNRPFSVENYNPEWITKFHNIKEHLKNIFGEKALAIEHVGSTSIAGMKAKPIIDALVIIQKMEDFEKEKEQMINLGYKWGKNYIGPDTLIFFKEDADERKTENIHICLVDSPKAIQFIQTRDYLRLHPDRATAYGNLKEELQKENPGNYPAYRAGKQAFLDETERLAYEWKAK